jgi:hypothetical protein
MESILTFINEYYLLITAILVALAYIADWTGWEWLDGFVEVVKKILNLITPGKKLYSLEDVKDKDLETLEKEEQEYRKGGAPARIAKAVAKPFKKKSVS